MTGPRPPGEIDRGAAFTGGSRPFVAVVKGIIAVVRGAFGSAAVATLAIMAATGAITWFAIEPVLTQPMVATSEPVAQEVVFAMVDLLPLVLVVLVLGVLTLPLLSR